MTDVLTPYKLTGTVREWTEILECDMSGKISGKVKLKLYTKSWGVNVTYQNCSAATQLMKSLFINPQNDRLKGMQSGLKYLLRHTSSCAM